MGAKLPTATTRIHKLLFELELGSSAQANPVQDRVSVFCHEGFEDAIDAALGSVPGGMPDIVLDSLVLELGIVNAETLEKDLALKITETLSVALRKIAAFSNPYPAGNSAAESSPASFVLTSEPALSELIVFLATNSTAGNADNLVRDALVTIPEALATYLQTLGSYESRRSKLAHSLSRPVLVALVQLLAKGDAAIIINFVSDLKMLHQQQPLVREPMDTFESVLWKFVLDYLLLDRGSHFNTKSFIGSNLQRMAQRYRIAYPELLQQMMQCVDGLSLPASRRYALPDILSALRQETEPRAGEATSTATVTSTAYIVSDPASNATYPIVAAAQDLHTLEVFFEYGVLPETCAYGTNVAVIIVALMRRQPQHLCAMVRRLGARSTVRTRLLDALTEPALQQLVCLLEPVGGVQINDYVADIRQRHVSQAVIQQDSRRYARSLWEIVLNYLLVERGSYFNTRSFIKNLIQKLAARHGLRFQVLLKELISAAPQVVSGHRLGLIFQTLAGESLSEMCSAGPETALANRYTAQEVALHYLEYGRLPSTFAAHTTPNGLAQLLRQGMLFDDLPAALLRLRPLMRQSVLKEAIVKRLLQNVAPFQLLRLLHRTALGYAGFINTLLQAAAGLSRHADLSQMQQARAMPLHVGEIVRLLLENDLQASSPRRFLDELSKACARTLGLKHARYIAMLHEVCIAGAESQTRFMPLLDMLAHTAEMTDLAERLPLNIPAEADYAGHIEPDEDPLQMGPSATIDSVSVLRHFLQYGRLPSTSGSTVTLTSLFNAALTGSPGRLRQLLLKLIGRDLERVRLLEAVSPMLLEKIVQLLLPDAYKNVTLCMAAVHDGLGRLRAGRSSSIFADEVLRQIHAQRSTIFNLKPLLRKSLQRLSVAEQLQLPDLLDAVKVSLSGKRYATAERLILLDAIREVNIQWLRRVKALPEEKAAQVVIEPSAELPTKQAFYVENAGMVLLWPFFDHYFRTLGLLEGQQFRDVHSSSRAVKLLQFLVNGDEDPAEHALLLGKILCGMPSCAPLSFCDPVTDLERELSRQLLFSVTQNWDKLKNSSIEALQETFLTRSGTLTRGDDDWTLSVEKKPFDMLLGSLPWGLSTIRLSWMSQVLWVKWT
ncbi:contractile injection system tape measure protein [Glaciimonas sp. PAMC28666]|uniref:contractile injection system tape measure protein n=1 Tax=Glaciimonas sp. PAMC28666 TaxID=2807626 RepID=UPI001964BA79|nr:contractile injection system tape measure protein [Glaciimonas sp. PAMC28666]QRX82514.1 hypothetical protein JQN73_20985 [Glaciimonas sp. PAMC28666]